MPLSAEEYRGPILVSVAYMLMYYTFIIGQVAATYYLYFQAKKNAKAGEKIALKKFQYGCQEPLKVAADRAVGNTLEQMVPFLAGMWVYAVFVSAEKAANLGWAYVVFRSIYPVLFYLGNARLLATVPNYIVIAMYWFGALQAAL